MPGLVEDRPYLKTLCKNMDQGAPDRPAASAPASAPMPRHILRPRAQPRPRPNAKIPKSEDTRKTYVYIDHSNFWISRKIATKDPHWRYDVNTLQSVLTSNTLSTGMTSEPDAQVHVYGYVPDDLKNSWADHGAKVHKLKKPHPLDNKEEEKDDGVKKAKRKKKNTEKEVDTRLVADSVAEAARALREGLKNTQVKFVIVSGDRDMRPAVKKIINYGYKVNVWSWEGALSKAYRDLEAKKAGRLKVHLLDYHKSGFVKKPSQVGQTD